MHVKTVSPLSSWGFLKFWDKPWEDVAKHLAMCKGNVLPSQEHMWAALAMTPFEKVKCVILGQDPYHTRGMAHGLAFSVLPHVRRIPPSLANIFREYQSDLNYPKPRNGDLRTWAERGVLLLNTVLTVEEGKPNSHRGIGWEKLTYEVVRALAGRGGVCFVLWGIQAQEYSAACEDCPVVRSAHPSPLAKGFLGSKPFSRVNEALKSLNIEPIDWRLC